SKATSAYRHRFGERRQVHHLLVPGGELGMARPPRLVGVAEVEIAQRAANGDLADRVEVAERGRLLLELDDGARHLALLERNVADPAPGRVLAPNRSNRGIRRSRAVEEAGAVIKSGHLNGPFPSHPTWRPQWSLLRDREAVQAALQLLVDFDWLSVASVETGGRKATLYSVNPKAVA